MKTIRLALFAAVAMIASAFWDHTWKLRDRVVLEVYRLYEAGRWLRDAVIDLGLKFVRALGRTARLAMPQGIEVALVAAASYMRRQMKRRPLVTPRFRMCPST